MAAISNEIYIGSLESPSFYFTNADILSASGEYAVDLIGDELSIDRFTPTTRYTYVVQQIFQPADHESFQSSEGLTLCGFWNENIATIPYGTPLWYFVDGEMSGKFYIEYVERTARDQWTIHAMSVIGLLDLQYHRGGVYTGETFAQLLVEIFGGEIGASQNGITSVTGGLVDCHCEDAVAATTVHGLLPYDTKRNNLHQLIFAYLINLTKDANGDLVFSYLRQNETPPLIPRNRIYIGGSVGYEQPVTDVELTEYTYIFDETAAAEEVYNNVSAPHISGEALVTFKMPINPATITTSEASMIVRDANEVSAFVTGNGIIKAVPYQVQSRVISRSAEHVGVQKTVSVTDVTLVNPLNSTNVLGRLYDFYTNRKVVNSSVLLESEKPGKLYQFFNPYDELVSGFIHRMSVSTTSISQASCELITDYTPLGSMTNLQNAILLQGSGTWEVPPSVRQRENPYIKAILIGGGQGGHGGHKGANSDDDPLRPGGGGDGGPGGAGGKILSVEINVSALESIAYSCGDGGEGGASDKEGAEGGITVFGEHSTEDGAVSPGGVMNLIDGKFYGKSGSAGLSGVGGGAGMMITTASPQPTDVAKDGEQGVDFSYLGETWSGGKGGKSVYRVQAGYAGWAFGAGGGGAAYGASGDKGGDGYVEWQAVIGGTGGTGATAKISGADAQHCGCGGHGGHGGGGGGAPGASGYSAGNAPTGYAGKGGKGSQGGKGAPGGILIYY